MERESSYLTSIVRCSLVEEAEVEEIGVRSDTVPDEGVAAIRVCSVVEPGGVRSYLLV